MSNNLLYDEKFELVRYVWRYYRNLLTPFECRVERAAIAREKAAVADDKLSQLIMSRSGCQGDLAVDHALTEGFNSFQQLTCDRIMADNNKIRINRCPCCSRILRTPKAQQCFWCGHDWHSSTTEQVT